MKRVNRIVRAMGGECTYQPTQTLILLDNVGRLWYINEVQGVTMESDEWSNTFLFTPEGGMLDGSRPGVILSNYTADGLPMVAMSLYDYWNNGTSNQLYLYIPGYDTGEMDYETWEPIMVPARLYDLGNTGEYAFIASIHSAEVTGGVDAEEETLEPAAVNKLAAGVFGK